ncbi:hypothetical protein CASFOL_002184 [Castilleja foliolosa]|uniref:BHLH domain-containing protein n=1 Tax=Castilleja foliolosa TaxID=1961234 RepID=A0ABD3EDU5_9LAMI
MADDYQMGNGSWNFGLPSDLVDMKSRSPSGGGSPALHGGDQSTTGVLALSSESMDWNQSLFNGDKAESSFSSLLEEDMMSSNSSKFQKLLSGPASSEGDFEQINRGFSIDQPHFSQASSNDRTITSLQNLTTNFQGMNSGPGMLLSENRPVINYPYPSFGGYGASGNINTPFWNAPAPPAVPMANARSHFFTADQASCFDETLTKNTSEIRNLMSTKKNISEQIATYKRPRNETPSPLPVFKVRKEKMGDRVTALQQLVSPFGKTDTASVLSEAIEYIKFLHEQVNALLSNPYMKIGAHIQHQQNYDKSRHDLEGHRQDLISRGLCLVPVSSTFPMTHETTVDFWTPTFAASFR